MGVATAKSDFWSRVDPECDLILVANRRMLGEVRRSWMESARERRMEVWPAAPVMLWGSWIGELCELVAPALPPDCAAPVPARSWELRLLWRRAFEKTLGDDELAQMPLDALAASAQETWSRLCDAGLGIEDVAELADFPDAQLFVAALEHYANARDACGLREPQRLALWLQQYPDALRPWVPRCVWLSGFVELPVVARQFLDWLCDSLGVEFRELRPGSQMRCEAPVEWVRPVDAQEQYERAAQLAREYLENHGSAGSWPRVGILVPDVRSARAGLVSALERQLHARDLLDTQWGSGAPRLWNISLGEALCDWPLIAQALELLGIAVNPDSPEPGSLLRLVLWSAAPADEAEMSGRLQLEYRLRQWPQNVRLRDLRGMISQQHSGMPRLCAVVDALMRGLPSESLSVSRWVICFEALLQECGWPGKPDSLAWQLLEAWNELLGECADLDQVTGLLSASQALSLVRRMAAERLFQSAGGALAPVQVMGMLEAEALEFDLSILLDMTQESWPPPARPAAFLPPWWQVRHGLPRSSARREAQYATQLSRQIWDSTCDRMILMAPRQQGDVPLVCTTLLDSWSAAGIAENLTPAGSPLQPVLEALDLLGVEDELEVLQRDHQSGGTRVLEDQSRCPFAAAVNHRLELCRLPEPEVHPSPRCTGILLHDALELLMAQAPDPPGSWLPGGGLIEDCLRKAHARLPDDLRAGMSGAVLQLEIERLVPLIERFFTEFEHQRPPYRVEHLEQRIEMRVGPLVLRGRIDRLDRELEDQSLILLDYKTGTRVQTSGWFNERPAELQLPLYAAFGDAFGGAEMGALGLVQLRDGERIRVAGLERRAGLLKPGRTPRVLLDDGLINAWRERLLVLAQEYADGFCLRAPRDRDACTYCGLEALCRIDRRELQTEVSDAAD